MFVQIYRISAEPQKANRARDFFASKAALCLNYVELNPFGTTLSSKISLQLLKDIVAPFDFLGNNVA